MSDVTPANLRWALNNAREERDELERRLEALKREIYALNDRLWIAEHPDEPAPEFELEEIPF